MSNTNQGASASPTALSAPALRASAPIAGARVAVAKALCKRSAELCGVDFDDSWKAYGEDFLLDADAAIVAMADVSDEPFPDARDSRAVVLVREAVRRYDDWSDHGKAFDMEEVINAMRALLNAKPARQEPTTCGWCSYEEAEGELIEQCAKCKAVDAAKATGGTT
jgi:hypothetical protein